MSENGYVRTSLVVPVDIYTDFSVEVTKRRLRRRHVLVALMKAWAEGKIDISDDEIEKVKEMMRENKPEKRSEVPEE